MELENSTILITGGTSGIGLELVKQLTEQGAHIIITARNIEALKKVKLQFPNISVFQSDVSSAKDIQKLYEDVTLAFPKLNILINNAGIMREIDLQDSMLSSENITREINTNLTGTIQMVHQFLPHLKKQKTSAIINVSSAIAFMGYSIAPIYSASKAGVHTYTKVLRAQLKKTNVKVIEIIPPGVITPLQNDFEQKPNPKQMMQVDKMVNIAITGLLRDKTEIKPGLSKVVKIMSRFMPNTVY